MYSSKAFQRGTSLLLARRGVNVVTRASSSAKRDFSGAAAAVRAKEEVAAPSTPEADHPAPETTPFRLTKDHLEITIGSDVHHLHWFWLYHNCDSWLHPQTKERLVDVCDIPLDIRPRKVNVWNGEVHITWPGNRNSVFSLEWLAKHSYGCNVVETEPPASDVSLIEMDYEALQSSSAHFESEYAQSVLDRIERYGAVVVRNRGLDTEAIIKDFLPPGRDVWPSHFGRIEDLRTDNTTNKNTDQLGYTNVGVAPHTDMPFVHDPPGMQLLHGQRAADVGGESYLVDARGAAKYLKSVDPAAFELLSTVPVKFHRKQQGFEAVTHYPIIQCKGSHIEQVRYSYFTLAPFRVPFNWMRQWYEAYAAFSNILHDEAYQFRFLLNPGDFVLYSNISMVHARESFSGPRWVRGVYFEQALLENHLRSVASGKQHN